MIVFLEKNNTYKQRRTQESATFNMEFFAVIFNGF